MCVCVCKKLVKTRLKKSWKQKDWSEISSLDFTNPDMQLTLVTVYFGCGLYEKGEVEFPLTDPKLKKIGKWMCTYIFYTKKMCTIQIWFYLALFNWPFSMNPPVTLPITLAKSAFAILMYSPGSTSQEKHWWT